MLFRVELIASSFPDLISKQARLIPVVRPFLSMRLFRGTTISPTSLQIIILHFVPLNTLRHIYISLIQPYLLYGIVTGDPAAKTVQEQNSYTSKTRPPHQVLR